MITTFYKFKTWDTTKQDRMFIHLSIVCGWPLNESYKVAYGSDASLNSCSAMASRKLREENISMYIRKMYKKYAGEETPFKLYEF